MTVATVKRLLLAFTVALAVGTGTAGAPAEAEAADTYTDPSGDIRAGWEKVEPDIAQVTLTSTDDGAVTFDVRLATANDLTGGPPGSGLSTIFVNIDADRNPSTGNDGAEYTAYQIGPRRFAFRKFTPDGYVDFPHQPTSERFTGTDLIFTIDVHDLGVERFDFFVTAGNLDAIDRAPDTGAYAYPPTIKSLVVPAALLRPKAGRIYRVSGVIARLSNDATVAPESVACTLTYRGKVLRALAGGCGWKLRKSFRRKTLRLSLTATYRGTTATFVFAIRPR